MTIGECLKRFSSMVFYNCMLVNSTQTVEKPYLDVLVHHCQQFECGEWKRYVDGTSEIKKENAEKLTSENSRSNRESKVH